MLRTRFNLGMLPLLLLLMLVGVAGIVVCRNLGRSMEERLAQSFRMVLAAHEMRDAATGVTAAIHRAQEVAKGVRLIFVNFFIHLLYCLLWLFV
jgi:hypothetical protein